MELKIIYENNDLLAVDKPAGIIVFHEVKNDGEQSQAIIDLLIEKYPKLRDVGRPLRYGIVHRLDKDTSGILLVAKNNNALEFLQKQFKNREVEKKYIALTAGNIKLDTGIVETLIGRSPQNRLKQKTFSPISKGAGRREAVTEYKVLSRYKNFTLLEVTPKTGRKHQIRCHLAYINHPIACDRIYGFKNQPVPGNLKRHFLHASYLKIKLPGGEEKEFNSVLSEDLSETLENLLEIE